MRCPACGFVTFDHLTTCKQCGKELPSQASRRRIGTTPGGAPPESVEAPDSDSWLRGPTDIWAPASEHSTGPVGAAAVGGTQSAGVKPGRPVYAPGWEQPPDAGFREERPVVRRRPVPWTDPESLRRAGFWLRSLAFLVDVVLVGTLVAAAGVLVNLAVAAGGAYSSTPEVALEGFHAVASLVLAIFIDLCYFTLFVGWRGQTPGKMILGMKIIRVTGREVGYARALVRWIGQGLSFVLLGIGFLMVAFSRRKQGLHDRLAGTVVVWLPS